jgi:hypothetical protein
MWYIPDRFEENFGAGVRMRPASAGHAIRSEFN